MGKYICVDFDGTIVDHMYPDVGVPVPGAVDWMKRWIEAGAKLILFTTRSDNVNRDNLSEAVAYLETNGISLAGVNRNPGQDSWTSSPKASAHIYVDDAAFGCPLVTLPGFYRACVDWSVVGPEVEKILLQK